MHTSKGLSSINILIMHTVLLIKTFVAHVALLIDMAHRAATLFRTSTTLQAKHCEARLFGDGRMGANMVGKRGAQRRPYQRSVPAVLVAAD